jgi:RNA exonuclease 1
MSRLRGKQKLPSSATVPQERSLDAREGIESFQQSPGATQQVVQDDAPAVGRPEKPIIRCKHHLGKYSKATRAWACCKKPTGNKTEPCSGAHEHVPCDQAIHELIALYQCYPTTLSSPTHSDIRRAVALDCEMGQAANGDPELIRVTLIDYFSDAVLIDKLVEPDVEMAHLNTKYSGVTWADMKKARRERTILRGKFAARQAVWRYVGPNTIVVGHGLNNDLHSLRWIHRLVVDSFVTAFGRRKTKEAEEARAAEAIATAQKDSKGVDSNDTKTPSVPKPDSLSLKALTKRNLGRDIQKGKSGHDSLEDAIASRDLVHGNVLKLMGKQSLECSEVESGVSPF